MMAIMIGAICTRTTEISCLIKHLLLSWPTSALISLFDVFSFVVVFQGKKIKEHKDKFPLRASNHLSWILWVAIILCDWESSTTAIVPHQYQFLLVEIKLVFMV